MAITWPTWTDDSGGGTDGTILNNAQHALDGTAINNLIGDWVDVAFNAANFTGSGAQTFTLASGDQASFAYRIHNKSMLVTFNLVTCSVGGTPAVELRIAIPASKVCRVFTNNAFHYSDNGTTGVGVIEVNPSGTYLRLLKPNFANWTASTNLTEIRGEIEFGIN